MCTIEVRFAPSTTGSRTATLTVTDNVRTTTQNVPLSGKGNQQTERWPSPESVIPFLKRIRDWTALCHRLQGPVQIAKRSLTRN